MALKPSYTQGYHDKLNDYLTNTPLEDLPLKHYKDQKSLPHLDVSRICEKLDLRIENLKTCDRSKQIIAKKCVELSSFYSGTRLEIKYPKSLELTETKKMTNESDYKKCLNALKGVNILYRMFPNLFSFNIIPFEFDRNEISAKQNFSEQDSLKGRTKDIPPLLFLKMMDAACRYILDYADDLFEAEKYLKTAYDSEISNGTDSYDAGKKTNRIAREYMRDDTRIHSPFPLEAFKHAQKTKESKYKNILPEIMKADSDELLSKKYLYNKYGVTKSTFERLRKQWNKPQTTGISLHKALYQFLPFCCTIIIMGLTARRESEVFSLEVGCVQKKDDKFWLEIYVAKTLQEKYTFSTVAIVDKAVGILERLSEKGRELSGSNSLFVFDDTFERAPTNMSSISQTAASFFDHIGVERNEDGDHWQLSEHQFRRFFAIMYFYRYSSVDTDALMHEFGHTDWAMTLRYLSQKMSGDALAEMDKQLKAISDERIADLAERTDLGGLMLVRLKSMLNSSTMNISASDDKAPTIRRQQALKKVKENSLVIDFIDTGLCFGNTPMLSEDCKCYRDGHVMIHDASDSMCKGCPAQLTVPEIAKGQMHHLESSEVGKSIILESLTKELS